MSTDPKLLDKFVQHFEQLYHLPPLAAKILGALILEGPNHPLTFEGILDRMQASKSSVSTSLNLLVKQKRITYAYQDGQRRKYFKPVPFSERLDFYEQLLESERDLVNSVMKYRERTGTMLPCCRERQNAYREHIDGLESVFKRTIAKLKQIEQETKLD